MIKGAVNIAEYYGVSQVFIGLTILAVGTDLPETVISVNASIQQLKGIESSGVIVGNAIGSAFCQISLVMGIAGLFGVLALSKKHIVQNGIMMLGSIIILFLVGLDGSIDRTEGLLLLVSYIIYSVILFRREKFKKKPALKSNKRIGINIIFLVIGIGIVIFSSQTVVSQAWALADAWGVKQSFVGIIILGLGTSLPELVISLNAILKNSVEISVGNLIGSNIFDTLIPTGLGGLIAGLSIEKSIIWFDLPVLLGLSLLVLIFFIRKRGLQKPEAIVLISIYIGYGVLKFLRY